MNNLKAILAVTLTAIGSAFVTTFQVSDSPVISASATGAAPATSAGSTGGAAAGRTPDATSAPDTAIAAPATTATWGDGVYTGAAVREPWGNFQVEATIADGKIVSISVVAAPTDGHSSRINATAIPQLTESAIAAQSAEVDTVSGATWTSESYATSLQAAIDAARTAGTTAQAAG
jgi:uncharacterized protein with FMN-binding domain